MNTWKFELICSRHIPILALLLHLLFFHQIIINFFLYLKTSSSWVFLFFFWKMYGMSKWGSTTGDESFSANSQPRIIRLVFFAPKKKKQKKKAKEDKLRVKKCKRTSFFFFIFFFWKTRWSLAQSNKVREGSNKKQGLRLIIQKWMRTGIKLFTGNSKSD